MSKTAEERALKAYPENIGYSTILECPYDYNGRQRMIFQQGYEQAEKDLGWISVKDKLPDTTEYVFTCVEMNGIPQSVGSHYYKDGKWWEGYKEEFVGAIEYWMEIPELKK